MDSKSLSHTKCQYHIVFIPKKEIIRPVEVRCMGDIKYIMQIQRSRNYRRGWCADHVHMRVSISPKISISNFMGYLKGKSMLMIYNRYPEQQRKWNKTFWAKGYYVAMVGNVTEDAIKKYIQEQSEESRKKERKPLFSGSK